MSNLNSEERAILEAFKKGELQPTESPSKDELIQAARTTFRKDKRVNIRISSFDLDLIQERASIEGIPYQTLMASVLHKFVNGRLVEGGA